MSYLFDYDMPHWPRRLLDQNFGLTITPKELVTAATSPIVPRYTPWFHNDATSTIKVDQDKWQINLDVQHFSPDEITVKIVEGSIVVEAKHEEKKDEHGFVSRQFLRRFKLPDDVNVDGVASKLSSDGVLSIVAPKKVQLPAGERSVPITHTGPIGQVDNLVKSDVK